MKATPRTGPALKLLLLLWIAAVSFPHPAAAGQPSLPPAEAEAVLQKLRAEAAAITSLSCRFVQEKTLVLFSQTVRFEGSFVYRSPGALRWEYNTPVASGFAAANGKGIVWSGAGGLDSRSPLAERRELAALAERILPWLTFDETKLQREYTLDVLAASPPVVRLTPKNSAVRRFLASLTITFAPSGAMAAKVHIQESSGDITLLRFSEPVINAPVSEERFTQ